MVLDEGTVITAVGASVSVHARYVPPRGWSNQKFVCTDRKKMSLARNCDRELPRTLVINMPEARTPRAQRKARTMINQVDISVPLWMLRRFAERAEGILGRHIEKDVALAGFEPRLGPSAQAFIEAHSAVRQALSRRDQFTRQQGDSAALLRTRMEIWIAALDRDVSGFDASAYRSSKSVASDVISHANDLLRVVVGLTESLAYGQQLIADITPLIASAKEKQAAAQDALANLQQLQSTQREQAGVFDRELSAFRAVLTKILGPRQLDVRLKRPTVVKREEKENGTVTPVIAGAAEAANDQLNTAQRRAVGSG